MPPQESPNSFARWLQTLSGAMSSVVFPAGCRLCETLLTETTRIPICCTCLQSFSKISGDSCEVCGLPWTPPTTPQTKAGPLLCPDCQERRFGFAFARSYGRYEGGLIRAILLLKYEQVESLGSWFAERLFEVVQGESERFAADQVVPVPLHRQRQKERGFNQVDLIAKPLARRLGIPYRHALLMRARPRPEKHLLRFEERWEAVRGAFVMREGGRVDNLRILLLDDVMTTGATLDACSRALREAGAHSVLGLTVARAVRPASSAGKE
jgi:competence protein ComFC